MRFLMSNPNKYTTTHVDKYFDNHNSKIKTRSISKYNSHSDITLNPKNIKFNYTIRIFETVIHHILLHQIVTYLKLLLTPVYVGDIYEK